MGDLFVFFMWYLFWPLVWMVVALSPVVLIFLARRVLLRRRVVWALVALIPAGVYIPLYLFAEREGYANVFLFAFSIVAPWLVYTRFRHVKASVAA